MLGIRHGYYAADALTAFNIDSTIDMANDFIPLFYPVLMNKTFNDPAVRQEYLKNWDSFMNSVVFLL